jgi:multimeric flavodoxin WrbA
MGRKIMFVCGSPNKDGNTNRVVGWVAAAARAAGAESEIIDAAHLEYATNGCIACFGCQRSEAYRCVIQDDATPIIARMAEVDAVVLASPVYWHGPSAQLKLLADRMYSLCKFDDYPFRSALQGKTLGVIGTAGGAVEDGLDLFEATYRKAADNLNLGFESLLVATTRAPEELDEREDVRERAAAMGRRLAGL